MTHAKNLKRKYLKKESIEQIEADLTEVLNDQSATSGTFYAENTNKIWICFLTERHIYTDLETLKLDTESIKFVERKYLEVSKVWTLTEKTLTQIIYAREAELSIQDYYFDQVANLRKSFDRSATVIGGSQREAEDLSADNKAGLFFI